MLRKLTILVVLGSIIALSGCSKKQVGPVTPAAILEQLQLPGLNRTSPIQTYAGDSLYVYIDGGAELYIQYNFQDVSTIELKYNNTEFVADIYRFEKPTDAFGLYSMLRAPFNPADSNNTTYGVESYTSPTSIDFVKGKYVVKLLGFEPLPETKSVLNMVATQLNQLIPGSDQLPETFALFPKDSAIVHSEKYYTYNFLGYSFLDDVYSEDYQIDGDTLTLFLSRHNAIEKFDKWMGQVKLTEAGMKYLKDLPYDTGKSLVFADDYYGLIVVGRMDGELAGLLNFKDSQGQFLKDWLKLLADNSATHK